MVALVGFSRKSNPSPSGDGSLVPKTSSLGTLLLSAYFGGAIASHMQAVAPNESYMIPAILLIVVWIAALIRNKGMFSSFGN